MPRLKSQSRGEGNNLNLSFGQNLFTEFETVFSLKAIIIFIGLFEFLSDCFLDLVVLGRKKSDG